MNAVLNPFSRRWTFPLFIVAIVLAGGALTQRASLAETYSFVRRVGLSDLGLGRYSGSALPSWQRPDGVALAVHLFDPREMPVATVLLLHGNTVSGSEHPLYRVLGVRLADAGHRVYTVDFAGFGGSGDPFVGGLPSVDIQVDVHTALDQLAPESPLFVVAHSGGAAPALSAGLTDERVAGLALLGPPRRTAERLRDAEEQDYFFDRAQENHVTLYGHRLPDWYTKDIWLRQALGDGAPPSLQVDLDQYLNALSVPGHKPILLVDNGWEDAADLAYLRRFHDAMAPPKQYATIRESDHYVNTRDVGRGWVFFDKSPIDQTVTLLDSWIRDLVPENIGR